MDNFVSFTGNITRDPELRFTQGGKGIANTSIAINRRVQVNGEWKDDDPTFVNLVIWDQLGENAAASLHKGDRVTVNGRLQVRTWEDKDGVKRTTTEVVCDDIAVSLRWARATIERVSRSSNGGGGSEPAGGSTGYGSGRPVDPVYGDEEPF